MLSKQNDTGLIRTLSIVVGALLVGVVFAPRVTPAATLRELISKARQEGALNASATTSMNPTTAAKLAAAFKKRFGLDIEVTVTILSDTRHYPKAAVATKAGVVPTYDVISGSDKNNIQLVALGGVQKINGWEALLYEINPLVRSGKVRPNQLSPVPLTGYAFQFMNRLKGIVYNTKLISKGELPKTHAELADPKYEGKWTQPPWSSHWDIGTLVFPNLSQEEWLATVRKAGKNAGAVQPDVAGVKRVALGEFAFGIINTFQFLKIKSKDPQAPIEMTYFKDYNQVNAAYYIVRKDARHPAAATLFALWMETPEAKAIWQPATFETQFLWGEGELERKIKQYLRESGGKVVNVLDSQRGLEFLKWIGTPEGRKYRKAVGRAIRGK